MPFLCVATYSCVTSVCVAVLCGICVVWLLLCGSVALLCGSVVLCGQFGVAVVWYCCVTFVWCGFCAAEWCHCQLCGNYLGHRTLHLTLTSPIRLESDEDDQRPLGRKSDKTMM